MPTNHKHQPAILKFIAGEAADQANRSLELLRAIEVTLQANQMLAERFEQTNARMLDAIEQLCGKSGRSQGEMLDESGEIQTSFEQTLDAISMIIDQQRAARESAVRDRELNHEDGVVESFDRFISALIEAHDLINELKWAIMEHDADRSPSSGKGPFRSAKELLASFQ